MVPPIAEAVAGLSRATLGPKSHTDATPCGALPRSRYVRHDSHRPCADLPDPERVRGRCGAVAGPRRSGMAGGAEVGWSPSDGCRDAAHRISGFRVAFATLCASPNSWAGLVRQHLVAFRSGPTSVWTRHGCARLRATSRAASRSVDEVSKPVCDVVKRSFGLGLPPSPTRGRHR